MASSIVKDESARLRPALAPRWHTALLAGLIVAVAMTGTLLSLLGEPPRARVSPRRTPGELAVFAQMALVQVLLFAYVARVGRGSWRLRELVGATWPSARRALGDVALAGCIVLVVVGLETAWASLIARPNAAQSGFLPHAAGETAAWLLSALVVGWSEEIVYRGYFQTQLAVRAASAFLGIMASAVLFGLAHLEQGPATAARTCVYGLVLGVVAHRRRSLLPGMIAHVVIDVAAGLLAR